MCCSARLTALISIYWYTTSCWSITRLCKEAFIHIDRWRNLNRKNIQWCQYVLCGVYEEKVGEVVESWRKTSCCVSHALFSGDRFEAQKPLPFSYTQMLSRVAAPQARVASYSIAACFRRWSSSSTNVVTDMKDRGLVADITRYDSEIPHMALPTLKQSTAPIL